MIGIKRTLAGLIGLVAICAALVALIYAAGMVDDFRSPGVPLWNTLLGESIMASMVFGATVIGARLLVFSFTGKSASFKRRVAVLLIGIGSFFPAFILSFIFGALLATHIWPNNPLIVERALQISGAIALVTAFFIVFFMYKRRIRPFSQ